MPLTLTTVTAATEEPLLLQEAKDHCRVDGTEQDGVIANLVSAAREYVETFTGRQLISATLRLRLDYFPGGCSRGVPAAGYRPAGDVEWRFIGGGGGILVPRPPLVSVSSITYVDTAGATQTLSAGAYQVDTDSEPGRIQPAYNTTWPSTRSQLNAVTITYVAGYATRTAVPASIKQAMLLLIGHWYENREAVGQAGGTIALAVESLLWSQRAEVL
jgi:hypothetical protein